jgi:cytochrome c oxidase subunit 5b
MFLQRTAFAAARRAAVRPVATRSFTTSFVRSTSSHHPSNSCPHTDRITGEAPASASNDGKIKKFEGTFNN